MTAPTATLELLELEVASALPCDWPRIPVAEIAGPDCTLCATHILIFPKLCAHGAKSSACQKLLCQDHLTAALAKLGDPRSLCGACRCSITGNPGHVAWWGEINRGRQG